MPRTAPMAWPATLQCCTAVLVPCSASSSSGSQSIHISTALLNDASSYLRTRLTLAHATATATATAAATLTATDVDADDNFLQIKYIQRHTTTPPTTYTYTRRTAFYTTTAATIEPPSALWANFASNAG